MLRPRSRTLRAMVAIALSLAVTFALLPAANVAAIVGGYYPVRISPDVPGSFAAPVGIATAPSGDLYIADTSNSRVKRMSPAGVVVSVWGSRGTAAGQFREPEGVAVLSTGRVVVADTDNSRLQLFEANGTYVGTWGGPGTGAGQFSAPCGLAVDGADNVYVADAGNGRIQKFSSAGVYLTTIGSSGVGNGQLLNPRGVAVDGSGNVYVADTNNKRIQKFNASGMYSMQWGLVEVGAFTYSRYSTPYSLAIDSTGNLLVADAAGMMVDPGDPTAPENATDVRYYVERCTLTGLILDQWGTRGTGPGQFSGAWGVAPRPGGGAYVTDAGNNRLHVFNSTGNVDRVWSSKGSLPGQLSLPQGLDVDAAGNTYVADTANDRIQVFDATGALVRAWGSTGTAQGALDAPTDVAVDSAGTVWVVEKVNNRVQSFTPTGDPLTVLGAGQLTSPEGIGLDAAGNLYITDVGGSTAGNGRVRKFSPAGLLLQTVIGTVTNTLVLPSDVALDAAGNIYVTDRTNSRVMVFAPAGTWTRNVGGPLAGKDGDEFKQPCGIVIDGSYMYVADSGNARILRMTTAGTWVATMGSLSPVVSPGVGLLRDPWGVARRPGGGVYVADTYNGRIQTFTAIGTADAVWSGKGSGPGELDSPQGIAVDVADNAYIADTGNDRIQVFDSSGAYVDEWGSTGSGVGFLNDPTDVAIDAVGNVWVVEKANNRVQSFTPAGAPLSVVGAGQLTAPEGMTLDAAGNIYVADTGGARVRKFSPAGVLLLTVTGAAPNFLNQPSDVALDAAGTMYVSDKQGGLVRVYDSAGVYQRTIGSPGSNPGEFSQPSGVIVAGGSLFVMDSGNNRVQRLTTGGTFETTIGSQGAGLGEMASPWRAAIDSLGRLVVAERDNHRMQVWAYDGVAPVSSFTGFVTFGTYSTPVTMTISATDGASGIAQTYYRINAGGFQPYTTPLTFATDGTYIVRYYSVDRVGNTEGERQARVTIDMTGPQGTFTLAGGSTHVATTTVSSALSFTDPQFVTDMCFNTGSGYGDWESYATTRDFTLGEGTHTVLARLRDSLNNVSTHSDVVTVDLTPPSTQATDVPAGWVNTPVTVRLVAADGASGVADTFYQLGSGAVQDYAAPFVVDAEGETIVSFSSIDAVGNAEETSTATVRIDTQPPTGTMMLAGGSEYVATATVSIGSDVPDALEMRVNTGSGFGGWLPYAAGRELSLPEGARTVSVEYRDRADNRLVIQDDVYVDLSAPVTLMSGVTDGWVNAPAMVTLDANDAGVGTDAIFYRVGSAEATEYVGPFVLDAEGITELDYWSVDKLGWAEEAHTATLSLDVTDSSSVATVSPSGWYSGPVTVTIEASDTVGASPDISGVEDIYYRIGEGAPQLYGGAFQISMQGEITIWYWSVDQAGNTETAASVVTRVDTLPPAGTMSIAAGQAMVATVSPTVDSDVPDAVEMRIDSGSGYGPWVAYAAQKRVTLVGAGDHTVSVEYRDRADNRLQLVDDVYLDLAAPVTAATGIPAGWSSQPVTVTLTPADADSTVAATYYRTDPGTGWSDVAEYSDAFVVDAQGETALEFWSVDALGNVETTRSATVRIDTIAPSGSMAIDAGAEYASDVELSISSAVSGASEMRVDYGDGFSAWGTYAETSATVVTGEGPFTIRVQYRDLALNVFELSQDILVDLSVPETTIYGVPGTYSPVPIAITLEATDTLSGVTHTYYRIGDSDPITYTVPVSIQAEGTSRIFFWSVDAADNVESPDFADVVIDSVPATPTAPPVITSGRDWVDLQWDIHPESDVTTYTVSRRASGDEQWSTVAVLGSADAGQSGFTYRDTGLTNHGIYEYRSSVEDAVGNESAPSLAASVTVGVSDRRLYGQSRYQTALAISSATFDAADTAVLATGASFADALGASSLAGALNAPILITPAESLPAGLLDELTRLGVERVIIIGGERAVSSNVVNQLSGFTVDRLAGADRYETAAIVASQTLDIRGETGLPNRVFVVRGDSFADALAASPVAYANRLPVLLVRTGSVPAPTRAAIDAMTAPEAVVVGGPAAISDVTAASLMIPVHRIQGANRYATAAEVAAWAIREELAHAQFAALATGAAFPDALTGGAAMGSLNGTVLLTAPATLPPATAAWFATNAGTLETVTVFGGPGAVSAPVVDAVRGLLR